MLCCMSAMQKCYAVCLCLLASPFGAMLVIFLQATDRARWCGKDVFTRSSRKCYPPRQKLAFSCIRVCFSVCTALTGRTWTVRALFCSIRPWTTKKCYLPPQSINFRHAAGERKQKRLDDCLHANIISFPSTNILKLIVVDVAGVSKAIVMIIRQTRLHTHTISEPWSRSATDLYCGQQNLKIWKVWTSSLHPEPVSLLQLASLSVPGFVVLPLPAPSHRIQLSTTLFHCVLLMIRCQ